MVGVWRSVRSRVTSSIRGSSSLRAFSSSSSSSQPDAPAAAANRRFEGKVAVVTGGASGIGAAVSRLLIAEGAAGVIIADIQPALGTALAASLGPAAHYLRTDVTREPDVAAAVDAALELSSSASGGGRLDVFVNNAGILGGAGAIDLLDLREYDHTLAVNLRGMVAGIKHAARAMKPARRGAIVCTGSTAGVVGGLGPHAYAVAKAGLRGLVRSAAFELRAHGVRVNMVSPDAVATPLVAHAFGVFGAGGGDEAQQEQEAREVVAARSFVAGAVLTPEAVAEAVAWLASDHAGYVTGHDLAVDGGRTVVAVAAPGDAWFTGRLPFLREGGARGVPPPPSSQDD